MSIFFLSIYIALIFIRPMDWWEPVLNFQLVTAAAIMTLFSSMPLLLNRLPKYWKEIPELRAGFFIVVGVVCSWMYPPYIMGMWISFSEFGKVFVLYVLVVILTQSQRNFRVLLWTLLLCTGWMAVHGILMGRDCSTMGTLARGFGPAMPRWRPSQKMENGGTWQIVAYGIFEDPNDLCLVFIVAMPLLYAEYKATHNPAVKLIVLAMVPMNAYAAYFTNSRGGLVGIFGMAAAYIIGRLKGFKRWFMIVCSVGLITVGAPARGGELGVVDSDRLAFWGDGLIAWRHSPLIGIGYNNFGTLTAGHAAHNTYVQALTELGMIGYIPFMLLLFLTITHMRRAMALKERIDKLDQVYLVGLFSATIGYLTAVYFLSRTYSHVLYIVLGLSLGKVIQSCRDEESFQLVFGHRKTDIRRGLYFAFGTIPFIWGTIRLGHGL